jgi:hypothetical protein
MAQCENYLIEHVAQMAKLETRVSQLETNSECINDIRDTNVKLATILETQIQENVKRDVIREKQNELLENLNLSHAKQNQTLETLSTKIDETQMDLATLSIKVNEDINSNKIDIHDLLKKIVYIALIAGACYLVPNLAQFIK